MTPSGRLALTIGGGVALGAALTASPLTLVCAVVAVAVVAAVRRDLPPDEQRAVTTIIVAAILVRLLMVLGLVAWSIPYASAQSGGVLFGDEGYMFERSLRTRDIFLGLPVSKLDYMMVFDSYANNKYMWWMSWVQTVFGPSPHAIRLLNGLLFVAASAVMYRLARPRFGVTPALWALAVTLFLPSLLIWSVSLLKDSVFFLLTSTAVAGAVAVARDRRLARLAGAVLLGAALWALADLRPGAIPITAGGIALGFVMVVAFKTRTRGWSAATAALALAAVVVATPPLSAAALERITWLSRQHIGHATTPGHAYHTLDAKFYDDFEAALGGAAMTRAEAARYAARSLAAFVLVPLPWDMRTVREFAFLPEHVAWYAIVVCALVGLPFAYRRDPVLTSVLVGYIMLMSAALALTNGNVGTLVRLRGLVTRFVIWIAAVGLAVVLAQWHQRRQGAA